MIRTLRDLVGELLTPERFLVHAAALQTVLLLAFVIAGLIAAR